MAFEFGTQQVSTQSPSGAIDVQGTEMRYVTNRVIVDLSNGEGTVGDASRLAEKLTKVLTKLGGKVIDGGSLPLPPANIPASELREVPPTPHRVIEIDPEVADLEKLAEKLHKKGYTGKIKFSSQEAADIFNLFLSLDQNELGLDVKGELDVLMEIDVAYREHLAPTAGTYNLTHNMDHLNSAGVRAHTSTSAGAWERSYGGLVVSGLGVTIAILDIGFASGNYDITSRDPVDGSVDAIRDVDVYDFVQDDRNVNHADCFDGSCYHGTKSAAMAAGARNNHFGTAGVAPRSDLMLFRIGTADAISYSYAARAVRTAIYWGADVISMSFGAWYVGCNDWWAYFNDALKAAEDAGLVSIAGAGNDNTATGKSCGSLEKMFLPAAWSEVLSVGAHDRMGNRSIWGSNDSASNYGPIAEVWAPGGGGATRPYGSETLPSTPTPNLSCYANNQCAGNATPGWYFRYSGTSAAAPAVAGTVALMMQVKPSLTLSQARSILKNTNRTSSDPQVKDIVNADAALYYLGAR